MEDKITIPLTKKQRKLLLTYEPFYEDQELFRLVSITVKKGQKYEIYPEPQQLEELLDQIGEFSNNEQDEKTQDELDDLYDHISQYSDIFGDEDDCSTYSGPVCIIKVALIGAKIWRKIAIREGQTLHSLHNAIFDAFDRYDEHLYSFFFPHLTQKSFNARKIYKNSNRYSHPCDCEDSESYNSSLNGAKTTLESLHLIEGQKFYYLFDFGDEWWHELKIEKINIKADEDEYPRIIERKGDSPEQYPDFDDDDDNW